LLVLVVVPLLALLALAFFTRLLLERVEDRSRFVSESRIAALGTIGNLAVTFERLRVDVRSYVLATTDAERSEARQRFADGEEAVDRLLTHYTDRLLFSDQGRLLLTEFRTLSSQWISAARQVMAAIDQGRRDEAVAQLNGTVTDLGSRVMTVSREWITNNGDLAATAGREAVTAIQDFRTTMLVAIAAIALLSTVFGVISFRRIVAPLHALQSSVDSIAAGEYSREVPFTRARDETGALARSISVLKAGAAGLDEQRWVKSHASTVTRELQGATSLADFGARLLSHVVPLLGGGAGGFFAFVGEGDQLQRLATYGLADEGSSAGSASTSHGLVAQCARDRTVVTLTNLPAGYLRIASGLGSAAPVVTTAWPLMVQNTVLGVIEVATFRELDGRERLLLEEIWPVTAMSLEVLQRNLRTHELLDQLKETEEFFHNVLELAPDGMMVVDLDGTIRLANVQCEQLFGYTRDELIGQRVEMLVPDDVRAHHPALREAFARAPVARVLESPRGLHGQRKDGSLFPADIGLSPLPATGGRPPQTAVSIRDVTSRKRQELELREAKRKAEEATELKTMFLANMSHEIRTPMNAIIGLSHLALKTPLNAKQRDYISKVHNAGTSLLGIINDILDFSKVEAGKLDIESITFKLDDVINSVTMVTGQKATDKGLEFLAHISSDIPPVLVGDPLRLGQIVTNLVNNAIKFTDRGEVHLRAELVERTGEKLQLRISVRDTGSGMTKEQADRLFQPFSQADMSTTRKHGGTGLGLSISRRLVELMGGGIWVESEPGVGSTFSFTVWLGFRDEKTRTVIPERITKLRTLIVDDNSAARTIMEDMLRDTVSSTDQAASAAEAMDALRQCDADLPYHVVFMDWRMPVMDGLQAARVIKGDLALTQPPAIIMVTAFGRDEVREEAEQLGLDGFLVKPVTRSMIIDTLTAVFADPDTQSAQIAAAVGDTVTLDGMRILLAEDNPINQQIVVELVESAGARIVVTNNGQEAVDRLRSGPAPQEFDVVLMDLQMPVMDGHQATATIRADPRFASLPIVAMTAHATFEERQRCLASGMNEHLAKPIDPALLIETMRRFRKRVTTAHPANDVPSIAGLDTADGIRRVGGNRALYLKLLRQFAESQGSAVHRMLEALASGDREGLERVAHTVKGVAGNIGAASVQMAAAAVESLVRGPAPETAIRSAVAELAAALNPMVAQLSAALGAPEALVAPAAIAPDGSSRVDQEHTRKVASQVKQLLLDADPDAIDLIKANQGELRSAFEAAAWERFLRHVAAFAFTEAVVELDRAVPEPLNTASLPEKTT
jgi:two-component system sensor histidine kinase/response regulator